ncbi:hypothetical protein CR513_06361, partial [Mucuna pruriens]
KENSQRIRPNDLQDYHASKDLLVDFFLNDSDIHIAIRKSIRSCTKLPVSNFMLWKVVPLVLGFYFIYDKNGNSKRYIEVPRWKEVALDDMKP